MIEMAEVGSAWVTVAPSAKGFGRQLDSQVGGDLDKSGKTGGKRFGSAFGSTLKSAAAPALALLGTATVGSFLKGSIDEAREAQKVGALTNAVIKSTGGVANVTAKDVDTLASAISRKTGVDDEAIAAGQNMLLTFGNVRNEVGKGNRIFARATVAASDMAAAFGGDAVSNSKMLGKALNDPTKGVTALTRVGVSFTQQQKDQIKEMQKSGDLLGAQKVILGEVTKQTKGAAEATATSGDKMRVAFGNLQETVGTALLPAVDAFAEKVTADVVPAISEFVTGMQKGTGAGGEVAGTLKDVWSAAKPVGEAIVSVVRGFSGLPGATQKILLLAGAMLLLKARFADAIPSIQSFDSTAALATAKAVAMRGGAMAAGAGLAALASSAGGAKTALGSLATIGAGIATGFAVGGPWGAAIGGGAGALSVFSSQSRAAATAQSALDASGKRVAETLNQQTGALTRVTRATAAKELADNGAFAAGRKMGISLKDILDASLGNTQALYRVSAASESWANEQARSGKYTEKSEAQLVKLRGAIGATSSSLADQRSKIQQVNEAMGKGKDKTVTYTVRTPGLAGALVGVSSLIDGINKAIAKSNTRIKVGENAKGTDNWRGGLTWVGEEGPELINLAKGAQVIPNHKIGDVGAGSGRPVGTSRGGSGGGLTKRDLADVLSGLNLIVDGRPARLQMAGA